MISKYSSRYPQLEEYGKRAKAMFEEADTEKSGRLTLDQFKGVLTKIDAGECVWMLMCVCLCVCVWWYEYVPVCVWYLSICMLVCICRVCACARVFVCASACAFTLI